MDLAFTKEQETLQASARSFIESETSTALARAPEDTGEIARNWKRMVELGWPAVGIPEDLGGAGLGILELLILVEELGRGIVPGPFFATAGQFVPALLAAPAGPERDRLLAGIAGGSTGTIAFGEANGAWDWENATTTARRTPDGWTLSGTKRYVVDGAHADEVLVLAGMPQTSVSRELGLFLLPGRDVRAEPVEALDPTLRLATITIEDVTVAADRLLAEGDDANRIVDRCLQEGAVAAAMSIVGTCSNILDRTIDYARTREQFDQPIGSFQAVKHKLTDMYVAVERARSLTYFAGLTIHEDDPRRELASSMAKAAAGDCQQLLVQDGLQLHGGIGYTWEFDLHLYLKRAASLEALLGSSRVHRKRVAEQLGLT